MGAGLGVGFDVNKLRPRLNRVMLTESGVWNCPYTGFIDVYCCGGGGAGGGATGGGGGGGYTKTFFGVPVTAGEQIPYTIGAGGTATSTNNQTDGGYTQFKDANYRVEGGNKAISANTSATIRGGDGGSGGGGVGVGGSNGSDGLGTNPGIGQHRTTRPFDDMNEFPLGAGGANYSNNGGWLGGGSMVSGGSGYVGTGAKNTGGGGNGGAHTTNGIGGNGGSGIIILRYPSMGV